MKFCIWHDSCAVMACAKFGSNMMIDTMRWSYTETNFPSNLNYDGKIVREIGPWSDNVHHIWECHGSLITLWKWWMMENNSIYVNSTTLMYICIFWRIFITYNWDKLTCVIFSPNMHWWANKACSWLLRTLTFCIIFIFIFNQSTLSTFIPAII